MEPSRSRWRIRLRTLLIVVALAAILLGVRSCTSVEAIFKAKQTRQSLKRPARGVSLLAHGMSKTSDVLNTMRPSCGSIATQLATHGS